jgi:tRNA 2-thiouridine synthesizing protein E
MDLLEHLAARQAHASEQPSQHGWQGQLAVIRKERNMVMEAVHILEGVKFDSEGFMLDPQEWTSAIAEGIALREGIELTDRHWIVINFARKEFETNGKPPTMRRITQATDVGTKEIYTLFPGGPAKVACKIAGLGKPTGCI